MILVFAGAGSSKAVSPNAYPTTVEFFDRLPAAIKTERLFQGVHNFLKSSNPNTTIDIEQFLWAIAEFQSVAGNVGDAKGLPGWLLAENRLPGMLNYSIDLRPIVDTMKNASQRFDELVGVINQRVYEWYSRPPESSELDATWHPLLTHLLQRDKLELFTTNYDLVLEYAIDAGKYPIELGRTRSVQPVLREELWDPTKNASNSSQGKLTKLHGSVDWSRGPNAIHVGTPTFRGRHSEHVIIYPGFKGEPNDKPFTFFHQYFEAAVARASALVFVGFAFRDKYINDVLRSRRQADAPVVIVNPAKSLPGIPLGGPNVHYLGERFTEATADAVLRAL